MKSIKKYKKKLLARNRTQSITAMAIILVVAVAGVRLLVSSHAESPYVSNQADSGSLTSPATVVPTCTGSSDGKCVQFGSAYYSGKLFGINANLADTSSPEVPVLQQLGVNSVRGFIQFNGSTFADPINDGTIAKWLDTLTAAHIVPLPELNDSSNISPTPNIYTEPTTWANAVVTWCKAYCAGGTFYTNNTSANDYYAPHVLEMLNEPYGTWYRGGAVPPEDYAIMLVDTRSALNAAGLSNIAILGAADTSSTAGEATNPEFAANWTASVYTADNGAALNAIQGFTVHPYGDVNSTSPTYGLQYGWNSVQYLHNLYDKDVYVTEVGWCVSQNYYPSQFTVGGDCFAPYYSLSTQEANITYTVNQFATTSWIKGYWYYNLHPFIVCTNPVGGNNLTCITGSWGSYSLYYPPDPNTAGYPNNEVASPAFTTFQQAAQANKF